MKRRLKAFLFTVLLLIASIPALICPIEALADEGVTVKLHYNRPDGAYDGWDVWFWEFGKDGAGHAFSEEDGDMVATLEVTPGCTSVGFIVRTESWAKDVDMDQFIDIEEVVSGTVHVYVESGVEGFTKEYGDDVVTGLKLKTATYDGEKTVTVAMTGEFDDYETAFSLSGKDGDIAYNSVSYAGNFEYAISLKEELEATGNYTLSFEGTDYQVIMPIIYSTEKFEAAYTYTGDDLGATWTKDSTKFRLWAPTADAVNVKLYTNGTKTTSDKLIDTVPMTQDVNGTWVCEKEGDLNGVYYLYEVSIGDSTRTAVDPYARTTGVNGKRAMIIDLDSTDPEGWDADVNPHAGEGINDAIIYEGHIRDLTWSADAKIENRGKYLGLTETGTKTENGIATGLDHIKELGATHLHILPMYDFGSIDETAATYAYNWGYDPQNFNVPEGSYSTDPYKGDVRVKEAKQMVKALHDNGISVVMDVVYNHVYSATDFCFNVIVPGYFSRITETGTYSNGSGCGNDTATERSMVKKYIVDSVNYWAEEYHIDGFRFDLVGLMDTELMNEIIDTVHKNHPDVIFYGEGWSMTTLVTKDGYSLATQPNSYMVPGLAMFNDTIRDGLKGSVFDTGKGFVSGAAGKEAAISRCFLGADNWCKNPSQTINYASCHDNNTLYDRLRTSNKDSSDEDIVKMNNLAAAIYMLSEGTPFLSSGEEMLRTKTNSDGTFNSNSYNAGDSVNALDYTSLEDEKYAAVFDYYKGLIAFRKAHSVLRLSTAEDVSKYVSSINGFEGHTVGFMADNNPANDGEKLIMLYNAKEEDMAYTLPEGNWYVYINADKAGNTALETVSGEITVPAYSAFVVSNKEVKESKTDVTVDKSVPLNDEHVVSNKKLITVWVMAAIAGLVALFAKRKKK